MPVVVQAMVDTAFDMLTVEPPFSRSWPGRFHQMSAVHERGRGFTPAAPFVDPMKNLLSYLFTYFVNTPKIEINPDRGV